MTLSEFSLKNRYTVYALFIGAVIFGLMAYFTLPIQLFPDTSPPLINVMTAYPGAVAEDVANLVSDPIETEMGALEGVHRVSSKSQDGLSLVEVEFKYGNSTDLAAIDVQNAVSNIRSRLPLQISEPQIMKFSTSNRPVLTIGLKGDNLVEIRSLASNVIAMEIQRVSGVANVDVFGGNRAEISIDVDRDRLDAHGLSLMNLTEAIRNHNISAPAGQIRSEGRQYTFRIDEESRTINNLAEIPISLPGGGAVYLGNLAAIREGSSEDQSRFRVNGHAAIAVQVFKQNDANTVDVVKSVQNKFSELNNRYPNIEMIVADEDASFTRQVVSNMLGAVVQALLLATIIIFLFLGSFRRGLVVAISMPMSFLLTFAGMKLFGIQVDLVTLTAVILSVGMVVDASVVVLENITRRYLEHKLTPFEAALAGAKEIQFSVIAGNVTTITVLIPLLFLYGFVGKTFGPLAATMIIAFVSSLLVALSLVPILTMLVTQSKVSKMENLAQKISAPWVFIMEKLRYAYIKILTAALYNRWIVYSTATVLLVLGMLIIRSQGMELLPKMDSGSIFITVETPSGSSLSETETVLSQIEEIVMEEREVLGISTQIGFEPGMVSLGGGGVQGPTQGFMTVKLTPRTERKETIWDIQDRLRTRLEKVPNVRNFVIRESGSTAKATTASSIVVNIQGEDPMILDKLGDTVFEQVAMIDGVTNTYRSWHIDQQSIIMEVDKNRARELGLSPAAVARDMVSSLDGINAGFYRGNHSEDVPIRVRLDQDFRSQKNNAFNVRVQSRLDGKHLPVSTIIQEKEVMLQGLFTRENLEPTLDVLALHQDRALNFISSDIESSLSKIQLPEGYKVSLAGEEKDMKESRKELIRALMISFIAVYLLLVAQFKSFTHPITVLMSVPLSIIGVSIALWIAGKPVSMPVLVGLILLVGIVVNNSIILIDFIRQRREEGADKKEAIIDSVATRFRPIMMTSLSTIVGMIPLAMEWSLGAERFSPLAIAVIGGMTASTFLTMVVIPVLYDSFDRVKVTQE